MRKRGVWSVASIFLILVLAVFLFFVVFQVSKNLVSKIVSEEKVTEGGKAGYYATELIGENITRPKFQGYIIQFEDKPILAKKKELENLKANGVKLTKNLESYKTTLEKNHKTIKNNIEKKLNKKIKVDKEFYNVFNGISLDISKEEAEKLKKLSGIEAIYPNLLVNITLYDSVPLINADDVWQLQDSQGREITGKNITIAIIDTGIDYTHPDLGSCLIPPATENCFEENEITIGNCTDTDGGINVCVSGNTRIETRTGYDFCTNNSTLTEQFCTESGELSTTEISCPEGTVCSLSLCIRENETLKGSCDKVIDGWDFVTCRTFDPYTGECTDEKTEDQGPMDDHGHGTHVAGIAAGSGQGGLKGVAPDAKLYAYKVLNGQGIGLFDWIIGGIERATDPNQDGDFSDHADVISMSLGTDVLIAGDPTVQAVENAVESGVVVVVASGNSGDYKTISSPGISEKVITVGASDKQDIIASFSSKGPSPDEKFITKPDISAPGVNICSAQSGNAWYDSQCIDDKHTAISGTSMATPHVAGAAALLLQKFPNLAPEEIKSILMGTSKRKIVKKEVYRGHPYFRLPLKPWSYCNRIKTNEICTKVDINKYVEEIYLSTLLPRCDITIPIVCHGREYIGIENSSFILREDSYGPGSIINEVDGEIIKIYEDAVKLNATINNIPKGDYWLCAKSPVEFTTWDCFFSVNPDYYWNETSFVSEAFGHSYTNIELQLKYYLDATIFDTGAGRIDILKALEPLVVANSSINFGIVESSTERKITIKNIKNEEIELNIIIPETMRVLNISNNFKEWRDRQESNLIEDETYNLASTNVDNIIIPANSQVELTLKIKIDKNTLRGYYAGVIELTNREKTHTIPYSFIYPRKTGLYAPVGKTITLDGTINDDEWLDAEKYENIVADVDIYLKTGILENKDYLFIGFKSSYRNISFPLMYFDQGNKEAGNKGSRNRAFYYSQEDAKSSSFSIEYYPGGSVKKWYLLDGYWFGDGWTLSGGDNYHREEVADFIGIINETNEREIEIAIPLNGVPFTESDYFFDNDYSDLNLSLGDTVGFFIEMSVEGMRSFIIPNYGNSFDAMTFGEIVLLEPPLCTDTDNGKNYQVKGKVELRTGEKYEDSCSGLILTENYCENNQRKTIIYTCFKKCQNGACLFPSPTPTPTKTPLPEV